MSASTLTCRHSQSHTVHSTTGTRIWEPGFLRGLSHKLSDNNSEITAGINAQTHRTAAASPNGPLLRGKEKDWPLAGCEG